MFQLILEPQIKNEILMSWSSRKKKRAFFVPFILSEGNLFKICILSQCIVYGMHFLIHMLLHIEKHYFIHFCCLFLKLSKAFSVYLSLLMNLSHFTYLFQSVSEIYFLGLEPFPLPINLVPNKNLQIM